MVRTLRCGVVQFRNSPYSNPPQKIGTMALKSGKHLFYYSDKDASVQLVTSSVTSSDGLVVSIIVGLAVVVVVVGTGWYPAILCIQLK